jgi:hypothetical protein
MSEKPQRYGSPSRGVNSKDVAQAADALLRAGDRPTVDRIRAHIGSGSPNTVGPLLDAWWRTLAARLDAGPAALHRIPESIAQIAEALWLQALEEGRRRALLEQHRKEQALALDKDRLELRGHVLSLREGELEAQLRERDKRIADLAEEIHSLRTFIAKSRASEESTNRRALTLETRLAAARRPMQLRVEPRAKRPIKPRRSPTRAKTNRASRTTRKLRR